MATQKEKIARRNKKQWKLSNYRNRFYANCYMHDCTKRHWYCRVCRQYWDSEERQVDEMVKKVEKFFSSLEGKNKMQKAMEDVEETIKYINEAGKISWEQLHTPVDF